MLEKSIKDYLLWMESKDYAMNTIKNYKGNLNSFQRYVLSRKISKHDLFSSSTLMSFKEDFGLMNTNGVKGLARYLLERNKPELPRIYARFLDNYQKDRQVQAPQIQRSQRVLTALKDYLKKEKINIPSIKIENVDAFLANYNNSYAPSVCENNRSCIRVFLRYLRKEKIIGRDLASLLIGVPFFAQVKPPRFLRPKEIKKLFSHAKLSSPREIRAYAMLHLAFTLGLRPKEVSFIKLDDIAFQKGEISLKNRKGKNPIILPLPETTIKAIAAYIIKARPQSEERALFLNLKPPHSPISSALVSRDISALMKKKNLPSSAYWLRHTYAQNLLEAGASIYEIKEMLGHDKIQTTKRYIQVNHKLMRRVLFDETL